jgi:spermidine synthase
VDPERPSAEAPQPRPGLGSLYVLFFFSGAASLVYEIVWARELTLVFGGSHLAVTTVLSVFMGGLALGGLLLGRISDRAVRPLRLYALLEAGIALCGLLFLALMALYPVLYGALAVGADDRPVYLTVLRVAFAVAAMAAPTTLMGGTLPLLGRVVADRTDRLGRGVGFLYGINTLGAVAGALMTGLVLLPRTSATIALFTAIAANAAIAAAALVADRLARPGTQETPAPGARRTAHAPHPGVPAGPLPHATRAGASEGTSIVLLGIAVSGFCALGYEVLWTRTLTMVLGTSTYAFTLLLVAFLCGIGTGSAAYGFVERGLRRSGGGGEARGGNKDHARARTRALAAFGLVQILIGAGALAVTYTLRDLPSRAVFWQSLLQHVLPDEFSTRLAAGLIAGLSSMFLPAFLMGIAFPLAAAIRARSPRNVGRALGEVAAWDTVGAILGAAGSGLVLIYLFGVERSLQMLCIVNIGLGAFVLAWTRSRGIALAVGAATAAALVPLAAAPQWLRMWDAKYFAIYRNNQRDAFDTAERREDALANTDVLYYHEGPNETVGVIQPKGAYPAYVVNGRVEASAARRDRQCQLALGHLPMLLNPNPRRVFVLGLGSGMTLGATSVHPEAARITLAEIETGMLGVARVFRAWNHDVLDDPRLRIVWNDGRNFLATSREEFDVLTADPIHPWSGGASYLYTTQYFRIAAARLAPGGIACQWLPIYELSTDDLRTIVRTFLTSYPHAMLWLTHYDAELIGSRSPILLDEGALAPRIAVPKVREDLESVGLGSVPDLMSWFMMGTEGLKAFAGDAPVNTDDNLRLEFSAPRSMGRPELTAENVRALARFRESLLPYLAPAPTEEEQEIRRRACEEALDAGRLFDPLHAAFLDGAGASPELAAGIDALDARHPGYAPARILRLEAGEELARQPRLMRAERFLVRTDSGQTRSLEISAVAMQVGATRGAVVFVDNEARDIYAQRYVDAPEETLDDAMKMADSSGMTRIIATALGATTMSMGSIDIMRSPSSCSVATMVPISAAVAEPARPVASSAVRTGPSSRMSERPTTAPSELVAPKRTSVL